MNIENKVKILECTILNLIARLDYLEGGHPLVEDTRQLVGGSDNTANASFSSPLSSLSGNNSSYHDMAGGLVSKS